MRTSSAILTLNAVETKEDEEAGIENRLLEATKEVYPGCLLPGRLLSFVKLPRNEVQ